MSRDVREPHDVRLSFGDVKVRKNMAYAVTAVIVLIIIGYAIFKSYEPPPPPDDSPDQQQQ